MQGSTITLKQNCPATLIPAGDDVILKEGNEYYVAQALGGAVTLLDATGLFRVKAEDAALLGEEFAAESNAVSASLGEGEKLSEDAIWNALKQCFDPEIPVNIVDLGLVYDMQVKEGDSGQKRVDVKMTLTAVGCGMGPSIVADAKGKIEALPGIESAQVDIVWDPVWNPRMITPEGMSKLGLE
jgi:probable FeS assembly SUF system protein SufT